MNIFNNAGSAQLTLLVAALVLLYGLWTGQRQSGFRAMWRVLGTTTVVQVLNVAFITVPGVISNGTFGLILFSVLSGALAFLPFLVAALEASFIREVARMRPPVA